MKKMKFCLPLHVPNESLTTCTPTCIMYYIIHVYMLCAHPGTQVARSTYVYYVVVLSLRVYTKDK